MAMVLNLTAIKAPNTTISPASINVTVPGEIIVFVRDANKTLQEAFTLGVVSPFDSHCMTLNIAAYVMACLLLFI